MPALTAEQTDALAVLAEQETALLTAIAEEAHVSRDDLRWYPVGGDKPRSIVIKKRGANSGAVVKTISRTNNPEAWASWEPVLAQWLAIRANNGRKRVKHENLPVGKI